MKEDSKDMNINIRGEIVSNLGDKIQSNLILHKNSSNQLIC